MLEQPLFSPASRRGQPRDLLWFGREIDRRLGQPAVSDDECVAAILGWSEPVVRDMQETLPATVSESVVAASAISVAYQLFAAKWVKSGCARVRLRAARAGLFACTSIPADYVHEIVSPWPAFIISLEEDESLLVDPSDPAVRYDQIEVAVATFGGSRRWLFFWRDSSTGLGKGRWIAADALAQELENGTAFHQRELDPHTRLLATVGRLVIGLSLHLTVPGELARARHRAQSKRFRNLRSGPPQVANYVIGNDVRVDVSEAVREYLRHGGGAPRVQSLVRGHWKHQFHGAGRSLRRWQHIEPYWRGPEEGPVIIRSHVVGGPSIAKRAETWAPYKKDSA
jgi:hypothetical protein